MLTSAVGDEQDLAGQKTPARGRGYKDGNGGRIAIASAGLSCAGLGTNLLRSFKPCTRVSENKKGPRKEGLFLFLVAGARFVR